MSNDLTVRLIPLNQLRHSELNVRKSGKGSIATLAASIRAAGLIQNLTVYENEEGSFGVAAGERRFDALTYLAEQGSIPADHPIKCAVCDKAQALLISTTENTERVAMHPADELDAFQKMTQEDMTIDQIADAFGVTALVVERRLRASRAAPSLLAIYREDKISTDQLLALCATDDHELQVSAWSNAPHWQRNPTQLRKLVTANEIEAATDGRVAFIGGIQAFIDAGGDVRRDLFAGDGKGGFIRDIALLERLVVDKLHLAAADVQNEGWAWVSVEASFNHDELNRCGRVPAAHAALPAAEVEAIATLTSERETLEDELVKLQGSDEEEIDDEAYAAREEQINDRCEAIDEAIDRIHSENTIWPAEVKAYAGVLVGIDDDGVKIVRGLVRAQDRANMAKVSKEVHGGRETESAGRKENAISDALRRSLLGTRNLAAQNVIAKNVRVAKILLACQIAAFGSFESSSVPSDFVIGQSGNGTRTFHDANGELADTLRSGLAAFGESVIGKHSAKNRWDAMSAKTDAELDAIIAYGVAMSLSLQEKHKDMTAQVLDALDFDMADHFPVTGDNYLGRVPKGLIVDALSGAGEAGDRDTLMGMQKKALVPLAENRMAGKGWVPEIIRTPARKPKGITTETKAAPRPKKAVTTKKVVKSTIPAGKAKQTKAKSARA